MIELLGHLPRLTFMNTEYLSYTIELLSISLSISSSFKGLNQGIDSGAVGSCTHSVALRCPNYFVSLRIETL